MWELKLCTNQHAYTYNLYINLIYLIYNLSLKSPFIASTFQNTFNSNKQIFFLELQPAILYLSPFEHTLKMDTCFPEENLLIDTISSKWINEHKY